MSPYFIHEVQVTQSSCSELYTVSRLLCLHQKVNYSRVLVGLSRAKTACPDQIRIKLSLIMYYGGTRESEIGSTQVKVRLILVRLKLTILYYYKKQGRQ